MRRFFGLGSISVVTLAACGGGASSLDDSAPRLDVGTIIAGTSVERRVPLPGLSPTAELTGATGPWTGRIDDDGVVLRFAPDTVGVFQAVLSVTSTQGTTAITAIGRARAPRVTVYPAPVALSALDATHQHGVVSVEVEAGLPFRWRDWPCADEPCLLRLDGRPLDPVSPVLDGGVRVRVGVDAASGALAFDTLAVETCDHPDCRSEVLLLAAPSDAACRDQLGFLGRVAAGSEMTVTLSCLAGVAAVVDAPFVVEPVAGGGRVTFRPSSPGRATLTVTTPRGAFELWALGVDAADCQLRVRPNPFSFGVVPVGILASSTVRATNLGTEACLISGVELEGTMDPGLYSSWVVPNAAVAVPVALRAEAPGDVQGQARIYVAGGVERVALSAVARADEVAVYPDTLTFESPPTCGAFQSITVVNSGARPITLESFEVAEPFFVVELEPNTISPGLSRQVIVRFTPPAVQVYEATLRLTFRVGDGAVVQRDVALEGEATRAERIVERFEQLGRPKTDTVVIMAPQPGLQGAERAMRENLQAYLEFIDAIGADVRVALTYAGTSTSPRFEPTGPNGRRYWESSDATDVSSWLPTVYTATAAPIFETMMTALTDDNPDFAAFYRTDAVLNIIAIAVSDDDSMLSVEDYLMFALDIKGFRNTNLFSQSAIAGPAGGCSSTEVSATHGERLIEVANRTGGVFQSICTPDWSRTLEELSAVAFGFKSRFFLSNQPVIDTIEVQVNGVLLPREAPSGLPAWTYDLATNSINFSPAFTPVPSAEILVSYVPECL